MAKDARQPIAGWRNEALTLPIRVVGLDLTGKALRGQVRLAPGTPGPPAIDLAATTNANAEGIRLVGVSTTDGVVTSALVLRINKSTMQGLPASGELGSPTPLAYAMQFDGVTRLYGAFVVLDSAIDADSNPTNRLPAYGSPAAAFGVADGLTMTIGNDGVTVRIDGASELAVMLQLAKAEANRAANAAATAQASQLTAEQKAVLAGLSASIAQIAANDGGTYLAAIRAAVNGLPVGTLLTLQATSRATLAAMAGMTAGRQAQLSEPGREGLFTWQTRDMSALVNADPDQGLYVAPASDATGASGAWARSVPAALTYFSTWWGIADGFVDTEFLTNVSDGNNMVAAYQSRTFTYMSNLLPSGATIMFPAGKISVACMAEWGQKSIHIRGVRGLTIFNAVGRARTSGDNFGGGGIHHINGSNSSVKDIVCADLLTTHAQVSAAGILIAGGVWNNRQGGNGVKNIEIANCEFRSMSAPCICYGSDWSRTDPNGMQRTQGFYFHHNIIRDCDYEFQSLYGVENVWYYNNDIECSYHGVNREFYGFRCGAKNVHIYGNRIVGADGYPRTDARAFNLKSMVGPLNPPLTNILASGNIHIYDNEVRNWPIFADVSGVIDGIYIHNNTAINDPLPASAALVTLFVNVQNPLDIGLIIAEDNTIRGYDTLYYFEYGQIREAAFLANKFKSAGNRPNDQPALGFGKVNGSDIGSLKVIGNTIEFPSVGGNIFTFVNTPATLFAQVWGNVLPEHAFAEGDSRRPTAVGFGGTPAGKVQTDPAGPLYDGATYVPALAIPNGTNAFGANGTWAALTRDPNPTTYP